jgi:hypothetical protein
MLYAANNDLALKLLCFKSDAYYPIRCHYAYELATRPADSRAHRGNAPEAWRTIGELGVEVGR